MLAGLLLLAGAAVLTFLNIRRQSEAGEEAIFLIHSLSEAIESGEEDVFIPEPEEPGAVRPMPSCDIDGNLYVGILQIPKLGLELPVMNDWSETKLQLAPCRYTGSVYTDDMVICAHNYSTHFGRLPELSVGDEILFYGADGQLFSYAVSYFETLGPTDVDYMTDGEYPLTLFTCTWGGRSRITVRCDRTN